MIKIFLFIAILSFNLTAQTSKRVYLFSEEDGLVNPVTANLEIDIDANFATTSLIPDQSENNRDIILYNSPTVNAASLNGLNTVTFNGIDEYGEYATGDNSDVFRNEPYTIYIVFKVLSGTSGRVFDYPMSSYQGLLNIYSANTFSLYSGVHLISNTATITDWMIATCVFNGANSIIKINGGAESTGNDGGFDGGELRIASKGGAPGQYANIEFARILSYSGSHDGATRTQVQEYLNELYNVY